MTNGHDYFREEALAMRVTEAEADLKSAARRVKDAREALTEARIRLNRANARLAKLAK